jgi:DNA recombination protein RmuC
VTPGWLVPALLALVLLALLWLAWLALRRPDDAPLRALERALRDEVHDSARGTRQELLGSLGLFQQTLLAQSGDVARTQNEQIDSFRVQLAALQQQLGSTLAEQLRALSETNERRQGELRQAVETRLTALQEGNEKKLEQMRATVDEKLQSTLEQRLGESFRQVAERLEQVHKGLGDMQALARDVGALNRVLTNVKTRGVFGEVQLGGLLEQVFTTEQYATNVATVPGSNERVEFALRLPGRRDDGQPLWLPLDAKFPREDYERLLEAQDRADAPAAEAAAKAIEARLRLEARSIRDKYLAPPHTTDFAILFVPTEGLYAEALRRPGLVEALQREYKVMLAGPTTLLAVLNSLQMGFRTLALEKRSAEVWEVLGAVKTEFARFGEVLAKTKKKLDEASSTIEQAQTRSNVMTRRLKAVEAMPEPRAAQLLPGLPGLPSGDAGLEPGDDEDGVTGG